MENWQAIVITISVAGMAIAVGTLLFKAGSWKGSIDGWRVSIDGWRDSVDEWRDSIDEWKGSVDETLNEIREDIKNIFDRLLPDVTVEGSPLTLTDLGKSISEELDDRGWAKSMATTLKDEVTGLEPFEIHEFSESYMAEIFEPTEEQSAKMEGAHTTTLSNVRES